MGHSSSRYEFRDPAGDYARLARELAEVLLRSLGEGAARARRE